MHDDRRRLDLTVEHIRELLHVLPERDEVALLRHDAPGQTNYAHVVLARVLFPIGVHDLAVRMIAACVLTERNKFKIRFTNF